MSKYRCSVCNYIYDPDKGDPDGGIMPGTAFEDIADSWVCPVCGVTKEMFVEVTDGHSEDEARYEQGSQDAV